MLLALLGAGCRSTQTSERERVADSVVAAEQSSAGLATPTLPWERAEAVPHLRLDGATAVLGDTVYLIGGVGPGDTLSAIRTVDRFDQVGRTWSLGPELPRALSHIQAAVVGDSTVWIAGGFLGRHGGPPTAEVWRLDRRAGRWVAGPALPEARGAGALVAIGDTLYYAGGWGADRATDRGDVWQLLPRATSWRPRAPMPLPRGDAAAVSHGGRLLVLGGQQSHDVAPVDLNDVWAYDARSDRWSELAPMPATRSHMTAAAVRWGDWVLLPGGGDIGAGRRFSDDFLGYDAQRNTWRRLAPLPVRLRGANGWMRGDTLQLAGGAEVNNTPSNRYRWVRALRGVWMALPGEAPRVSDALIGVVGDELLLFGKSRRTTWHYDLARGRWGGEDDLPLRPRQGEVLGVASGSRALELLGGTTLSDTTTLLQSLDLGARRWSPGMPVPEGIRRPILVSGHGTLWLVGDPAWRMTGTDRVRAPGIVYRRNRSGGWDSVAVVPEPRFRSMVAVDSQHLCIMGGVVPNGNWSRGIQCLDIATSTWRSTAAGTLDSMPNYLGSPDWAAAVRGRFFIFGWGAYAFDPSRNVWDSIPKQPSEAVGGPIVADGDRLLQYSPRSRGIWMMWP